jgi:hypothetical protein
MRKSLAVILILVTWVYAIGQTNIRANNGVFTGNVSATGTITGSNTASKNASADHLIYVSSSGNDSNDGLSWGSAKLTIQAAFNTATTSGANPGGILAGCGTYTGPTTWYSNLAIMSYGASDSTGNNFGLSTAGTPCVKVTYASTQTLSGLQNIFIRNVYFDFANAGSAFILTSVANTHWDDVTANQCGNATTPCVLMKTIGTGGPAQNTMNNVFRGFHCIGNNGGGGLNATCFKLLGQGSVNCVSACGAVTLNEFYNTTCAGGILHCVDFELNSDTNHFYGLNCNQDVTVANSSCVSFNELTPASDQDADGELVFNMCVTGTFSAQIRAGQTNGSVITACTGGNGLPSVTVLGGTPSFDLSTVGLDGVQKATQYSGGTLGVVANNSLGIPAGAVSGDLYTARSSTTGVLQMGTDAAQMIRSGNAFFFAGIGGLTNNSILRSAQFATDTNCAVNTTSPAACGTSSSGAFVVPTTTTTYTVNTSAVTANSLIFLTPRTYNNTLPSAPTCVAPAVTSAPVVSAISNGVSFTMTLPSTTGTTCWNFHVLN